jgi:hypothetical protein
VKVSPRRVWGEIWQEFSTRRDQDRTGAYLTLIKRLSENGEILVPELIPPKDYAQLIIEVEHYVKADSGAKEGSAIEAVQKFLNGSVVEKSKTVGSQSRAVN